MIFHVFILLLVECSGAFENVVETYGDADYFLCGEFATILISGGPRIEILIVWHCIEASNEKEMGLANGHMHTQSLHPKVIELRYTEHEPRVE